MLECIRLNPSFLKGATVLFAMGWLRLVGSLKLQVSFAEYILFHRALSAKRPAILRSLLIVATSYCVCLLFHSVNPKLIKDLIKRNKTNNQFDQIILIE